MTLQLGASLIIIATLGKGAMASKTYIVQSSLVIVTCDCQNIFIVQATGHPE